MNTLIILCKFYTAFIRFNNNKMGQCLILANGTKLISFILDARVINN